jgi:hypothetical protein
MSIERFTEVAKRIAEDLSNWLNAHPATFLAASFVFTVVVFLATHAAGSIAGDLARDAWRRVFFREAQKQKTQIAILVELNQKLTQITRLLETKLLALVQHTDSLLVENDVFRRQVANLQAQVTRLESHFRDQA